MMRRHPHRAIVTLGFCALAFFCVSAQAQLEESPRPNESQSEYVDRCEVGSSSRALTADDGLAVIAAALDRRIRFRRRDCSHLVHAIYGLAGFSYAYASSSELYYGSNDFEQVTDAQPGDLVVWRGHVGIVVNPAQHMFFSTLRSGPGIDTYDAPHWKRRGQAKFYRYIKKCAAPDVPNHLLLTHQDR
jgi:NlpC/P60 family protein